MKYVPDALMPFTAYRQFIAYVIVPSSTRPGKTDKFPVDCRTGRVVDAHDPAIWTDAPTAIAAAERFGPSHGVGFVLTENDPFWFLDIDGCYLPVDPDKPEGAHDWTPIAKALVNAFPGAAVEVSSSGTGLHIFGTGRAPEHKTKNSVYHLEFYTEKRFAALTGTHAVGSAATDCTHLLPSLVHQFFKPADDVGGAPAEWTNGPCPGWNGPTDDAKLLERAMRSTSAGAAFGNRAAFRDLWENNTEVLSKAYPPDSNNSGSYDASSADRALAQHLAFWTGKDCERIARLMKQSALSRHKWDREDYLPRTILSAVAQQAEYLTDKAPEPVAGMAAPLPGQSVESPRAAAVVGATFLSIEEQVDLFKGCVYITDQHKVLVPGGLLLKPDQFRVMYGGYTMLMDRENTRTVRDAWEAFTQSQAYRSPRADTTCFKPDRAPAEIIQDAGRTRANIWWPVEVARKSGDITPFAQHLAKILPNERDRTILLSYMAACVQHKGTKFTWAPLLQGVEGNGKTILTRCVAEAVGYRYIHMPPANEISEKFNSWLFGTVFIGVEDIYVPDNRREIFEILKPMITGDYLAKRAMNTDQVMQDVCCNFLFNSNHKDGLRKTRNDRRVCVLYCAQQSADDLKRDGLGGPYFKKLFAWLRAEGYAIISDLLHTYPIPDEFNPATSCKYAPVTSSTEEAITVNMGGIEQEIIEAIEQGLPGFAGGWVSSMALDRLLDRLGRSRSIPLGKRGEMLLAMGYELHPGLAGGRVHNLVLPDAGKPRLYVRKDSPLRSLTKAADIARAYSDAQAPTANVPA